MKSLDPSLATVHYEAGLAKVVFISGHVQNALSADFSVISQWCDSIGPEISVRTGAVSPDLAELLQDHGFKTASHLVLLESRLELSDSQTMKNNASESKPISMRRLKIAARIDAGAFPLGWSMSAADLYLASQSTSTASLMFDRNGLKRNGFVLVGASEHTAYLQRLGVMTSTQRQGIGLRLAKQAMTWGANQGADKMLVNTEHDNAPALNLYGRLGFLRRDDSLQVMERLAHIR